VFPYPAESRDLLFCSPSRPDLRTALFSTQYPVFPRWDEVGGA